MIPPPKEFPEPTEKDQVAFDRLGRRWESIEVPGGYRWQLFSYWARDGRTGDPE